MKRVLSGWKVLLLILFLTGGLLACSSVESSRAPDQTGKINDLYVVINPGASFKGFGDAVKKGLAEKFEAAGVTAEIIVPTGLELNSDIETKTADHKYLFTIALTAGTVNEFNQQVSGVYDLIIYEVSSKRAIWRATVKVGGMAWGTGHISFIDQTIGALVKDGLIDAPQKPEPTSAQK